MNLKIFIKTEFGARCRNKCHNISLIGCSNHSVINISYSLDIVGSTPVIIDILYLFRESSRIRNPKFFTNISAYYIIHTCVLERLDDTNKTSQHHRLNIS